MIANIINVIDVYKVIKSIDLYQDIQQQILKWIFAISSQETDTIDIVYNIWYQKKLNRFQYILTHKVTLEEIILLLIGLKPPTNRSNKLLNEHQRNFLVA